MVYIRTDANEIIGTGHVMRCLAIADEFRRKSEDVTFLIADERAEKIITDFGFLAICLNSKWDDMESELAIMLQFIRETHMKVLLVDSYYATRKYLEKLHQYIKLIYIDDLNAFVYPVDMVINYHIYAEKFNYKENYRLAGLGTEFLLGCEFVPLRIEFRNVHSKRNNGLSDWAGEELGGLSSCEKTILITSGGTDQYNVVCRLLDRLKEQAWFEKTQFHVILGRFHQHEPEIRKQWSYCKNVFLHKNVQNISRYMSMCDFAVTAGGSTVYELCACGIPAVIYTLADNQHEIAREFDIKGVMPWCGDIRQDMPSCIEHAINYLESLYYENEVLQEKSIQLQSVVDGYGAVRIVEKIFSLLKKEMEETF